MCGFLLAAEMQNKYSDTCIRTTSKSKGKSKVSEENSDENLEASVLILRLNLFKCLIERRSYKPRLPQVFINFLYFSSTKASKTERTHTSTLEKLEARSYVRLSSVLIL